MARGQDTGNHPNRQVGREDHEGRARPDPTPVDILSGDRAAGAEAWRQQMISSGAADRWRKTMRNNPMAIDSKWQKKR